MHRKYNRGRKIRRRRSLKSTNAGPLLLLGATIFGILAALALLVFVVVPFVLPLAGIDYRMPWEPTPTPAPTPRPTPTPHVLSTVNPAALQTEVVLSAQGADKGYEWFADPYAYKNELYFVAGKLEQDGNINMNALYCWDMNENTYARVEATLINQNYLSPVCNEKWLVYLDGKTEGGGYIRAISRETGEEKIVKEVYVGQPQLHLDGDMLAWMERTGSRMDKVFVVDLKTLENTAVRLFNNSPYGQSSISMAGGELIYADEALGEPEEGKGPVSSISAWNIQSGLMVEYAAETYVHDPMTNGKKWAWRNGAHGLTDTLYWAESGGIAQEIVQNVVNYGISGTFVAYSVDEAIFVFVFSEKKAYRITPETERTQLLGVSNGVVVWMDITSRDRDIIKYARVEE